MFTTDLANMFPSDLANMFTSLSANMFTTDLANMFSSNLANIFTSELEKCEKIIWSTCSLVKLTGKNVGLVPGIRHVILYLFKIKNRKLEQDVKYIRS